MIVPSIWRGGHTHLKMHVSKWSLVSKGLDICLASRSLLSRSFLFIYLLIILWISLVKIVHFQLWLETEVLSLAKLPSWIGVETRCLYPIIKGHTLKSSSLKLGTCQGWNSFYLGLPNSVLKPMFWNMYMCGLPITHNLSLLQCMLF